MQARIWGVSSCNGLRVQRLRQARISCALIVWRRIQYCVSTMNMRALSAVERFKAKVGEEDYTKKEFGPKSEENFMKYLAPDYIYTPQGLQANMIVSFSGD